jgi:hypothetical protein
LYLFGSVGPAGDHIGGDPVGGVYLVGGHDPLVHGLAREK